MEMAKTRCENAGLLPRLTAALYIYNIMMWVSKVTFSVIFDTRFSSLTTEYSNGSKI